MFTRGFQTPDSSVSQRSEQAIAGKVNGQTKRVMFYSAGFQSGFAVHPCKTL